jgi:hypothetical protein
MQHPYYPNADKFIPNAASINAWLKTRKNNSENKPGIFETVDYNRDRNWSIASILIELAAFYFTFDGAFQTSVSNKNFGYLLGALVIVLLFVIFDIFGIMLHGQDKPQRTINKSLYLVTSDGNKRLLIFNSLKETTWREFIGVLLLSISAILKIFGLWWYRQGMAEQILVVFTILYILVIYIHSVHTVYWWPARRLRKSISKQYENFKLHVENNLPTDPANTINSQHIYSYNFNSKANLELKRIEGSPEGRVNVVNNGNGTYTLNVTGLLWDENIVSLAGQWESNNVSDLINACVTVQLLQNNIIVDGQPSN